LRDFPELGPECGAAAGVAGVFVNHFNHTLATKLNTLREGGVSSMDGSNERMD